MKIISERFLQAPYADRKNILMVETEGEETKEDVIKFGQEKYGKCVSEEEAEYFYQHYYKIKEYPNNQYEYTKVMPFCD